MHADWMPTRRARLLSPRTGARLRLLALFLCAHEGCATVFSPALPVRRSRGQRDYFARIGLSGALACSITHSMVVPLDVIKTRIQTDETLRGFRHAAKTILREQKGPFRARVFLSGASATATGYYLQGGAKFGGYELLKYHIFDRIERIGGCEAVRRWRLPVMMGAASVAEVFASVMLSPLEVTAPAATTIPHPEPRLDPVLHPSPKLSPKPSPSPSPSPNPSPQRPKPGGQGAYADGRVRRGAGHGAHARAHLARRGRGRALPRAQAHHDAPAAVHGDQARRVPASRLTRRPPSAAAAPHGHPCHSHGTGRSPSS